MSAVRSFVAAGIVGAVVWAFKREAERRESEGQGAEPAVFKASLPSAPQSDVAGLFGDLFKLALNGVDDAPKATPEPLATVFSRTPSVQTGGEPSNIGAQLKADLMRDFGLSGMHAGAIVANLHWESGGFKSLQEIKPMIAGSRGGFGYAQWTGPRRRQFEAWVKARGLDARSYAANYGFLKHELTNTPEKAVLPRLKRTTNMRDAVITFSGSSPPAPSRAGFLRPGIPHLEKRVAVAARYA